MAIVLNFLGVEVQERKLAANAQKEIVEQTSIIECAKISAYTSNNVSAEKLVRIGIAENKSSIKIEHNYKLSK